MKFIGIGKLFWCILELLLKSFFENFIRLRRDLIRVIFCWKNLVGNENGKFLRLEGLGKGLVKRLISEMVYIKYF